ncbi:type II secretion system protein GspL [Undibacterium sp. Ji22W]|uniref:type II secretion system protein GspL n=1 Tax=Undibacterium sp. Ji22W TaxID=3413038 RepID=UPI003BEF95A2
MASTLYIQLPPRTVADKLGGWGEQSFSYCLASAEKNILQQGRHAFANLQSLVHQADQTVLLVSASDVNFLQVAVPPMPFAKLKAAIPNLLEEQLLTESADLLFVPSPPVKGQCYVAVVTRSWIEQIFGFGVQLGATKVSAFALSDSLSQHAEIATILIESVPAESQIFEISVRSADQIASGLSIDVPNAAIDQSHTVQQIIAAINILAPQEALQIYVEPSLETALRQVFIAPNDGSRQVQLASLDWKSKIGGVSNRSIDLLAFLSSDGKQSFDWLKWRWSVSMIVFMVMVSLFALNWKWWSLQREANTIRDSIQATYQSAFPKEPASRDPLFQMQQKINAAKKVAGQSSSDDFLVLSAQFAMAWDQLNPAQPASTVTSVEYRERSLFVTPKSMADVRVEQLRPLLKERNLKLEVKDGSLKVFSDVGGM